MENRLSELFPIQSIGPLIGGILLWFGFNYLYLGPELIGPRLGAKYYHPACMAAVTDGREAYHRETLTLLEAYRARQAEIVQAMQQRAQAGANNALGLLFGGRPGSDEFMRRHGGTLQGWMNNNMAPGVAVAIEQRLQAEQQAFTGQMAEREKEARRGVVYSAPAQFCGCVVNEGLKERVDLAAFTATLRLYTPPGIRRLADGTMLHDAKACGSVPTA